MTKLKWNEITSEDVINAIYAFEFERPDYPAAKSTFLIYNGKKYPAKHIRGMAYKIHFGVDISKNDYAGGKETERKADSYVLNHYQRSSRTCQQHP